VSNPHTDDDTVMAQKIFDIIDANKVNQGIEDVLWGNQNLIPRSPTVVIMANGKRRALAGVTGPGGRTLNSLLTTIEVHRSKVGDEATERKATDDLATTVERLLHADTTLEGIIIHGFVEEVARGEVENLSGMFRTVRMMFVGQTKTYLTDPTA
jgi:hypothetical protein